jgi:hypothetical protein
MNCWVCGNALSEPPKLFLVRTTLDPPAPPAATNPVTFLARALLCADCSKPTSLAGPSARIKLAGLFTAP